MIYRSRVCLQSFKLLPFLKLEKSPGQKKKYWEDTHTHTHRAKKKYWEDTPTHTKRLGKKKKILRRHTHTQSWEKTDEAASWWRALQKRQELSWSLKAGENLLSQGKHRKKEFQVRKQSEQKWPGRKARERSVARNRWAERTGQRLPRQRIKGNKGENETRSCGTIGKREV